MKHIRFFVCSLVLAVVAASGCGDPKLVAPGTPAFENFNTSGSTTLPSGTLFYCPQQYDSVSVVVGREGGYISVGHHALWIDRGVLTKTVTITAVAPADTIRRVRFKPDGLQFPSRKGDPAGALLWTYYKDCPSIPRGSLRIAQINDALNIIGYLEAVVKGRQTTGSNGNQSV